jgi:uncharacterized protein YndB with AHSA1/START domain
MKTHDVLRFLTVLLPFAAPAAGAERTLSHELVVDAPDAAVWDAFTTKAGIESWMVPVCEIDLRPGGMLRTNYDAKAGVGGTGTITHRILAFEPRRMLAFRCETSPPGFTPGLFEQTWCVVRLEPQGTDRTRVTVTGLGWGEGAEWDRLYAFFEAGNAWTIEQLRARFARDPGLPQPDEALAEARRFLSSGAGGVWSYENARPDGSLFRALVTYEDGPDGKSFTGRSWLGSEKGMFLHGTTQVFREPGTGELRFLNVSEKGAVAAGLIRMDDEKRLLWDWSVTGSDGTRARWQAVTTFQDDDHFRFELFEREPQSKDQAVVDIVYVRSAEPPAAFGIGAQGADTRNALNR